MWWLQDAATLPSCSGKARLLPFAKTMNPSHHFLSSPSRESLSISSKAARSMVVKNRSRQALDDLGPIMRPKLPSL